MLQTHGSGSQRFVQRQDRTSAKRSHLCYQSVLTCIQTAVGERTAFNFKLCLRQQIIMTSAVGFEVNIVSCNWRFTDSNPSRVMPKTLKMVLIASLLGTQQ